MSAKIGGQVNVFSYNSTGDNLSRTSRINGISLDGGASSTFL